MRVGDAKPRDWRRGGAERQSAGLPEVLIDMSFWNGSRWVEEKTAPPAPRPSRTANWAATITMLIGLAVIAAPLGMMAAAASHKRDQGVAVSCDPAPCAVGGSMTVTGWGYAPSEGGQQVFLWVGYANDYCVGDVCHGFYSDPWVNADGTFSATFSDALEQAGTGNVSTTAYLVKQDKWVTVASLSYAVH
jgi:hypothetical protein